MCFSSHDIVFTYFHRWQLHTSPAAGHGYNLEGEKEVNRSMYEDDKRQGKTNRRMKT
jgi:hypothetical protein